MISPGLYLRIGHAVFCVMIAFLGGEAVRYLAATRSQGMRSERSNMDSWLEATATVLSEMLHVLIAMAACRFAPIVWITPLATGVALSSDRSARGPMRPRWLSGHGASRAAQAGGELRASG